MGIPDAKIVKMAQGEGTRAFRTSSLTRSGRRTDGKMKVDEITLR